MAASTAAATRGIAIAPFAISPPGTAVAATLPIRLPMTPPPVCISGADRRFSSSIVRCNSA